jgi:hypothetical protein
MPRLLQPQGHHLAHDSEQGLEPSMGLSGGAECRVEEEGAKAEVGEVALHGVEQRRAEVRLHEIQHVGAHKLAAAAALGFTEEGRVELDLALWKERAVRHVQMV